MEKSVNHKEEATKFGELIVVFFGIAGLVAGIILYLLKSESWFAQLTACGVGLFAGWKSYSWYMLRMHHRDVNKSTGEIDDGRY